MATAIIEGLMNELQPRLLTAPRRSLKAMIASVEGDLHQIGGKMVADVFAVNGWDARYLGANTPTHELLRLAAVEQPQVVGLSVSVTSHMPQLANALDVLQSRFPKLLLLVGGQGLSRGGAGTIANFPNARLIESLDKLDQFAAHFTPEDPQRA
jgi:methanogenic corrinoid protein MtbC1